MLQLTHTAMRIIRSDQAKREAKARAKAEERARAKYRKLDHKVFERLVANVTRILKAGEPTKFAYEGSCRHGLRRILVLNSWRWPDADFAASQVVAKALKNIGAERPSYEDGQLEAAANFSLIHYRCRRCGSPIDDEDLGKRRYCSKLCSNAANKAKVTLTGEAMALAEYLASLALKREEKLKACAIKCETCGRSHISANPGVRFCSKRCEGEARKVHPPQPCAICGTIFEQYTRVTKQLTRYCSDDCTAIAKTLPRDKPPREQRLCAVCGSGFSVKYPSSTKRFCSLECSSSRPRNRSTFKCEPASPAEPWDFNAQGGRTNG